MRTRNLVAKSLAGFYIENHLPSPHRNVDAVSGLGVTTRTEDEDPLRRDLVSYEQTTSIIIYKEE